MGYRRTWHYTNRLCLFGFWKRAFSQSSAWTSEKEKTICGRTAQKQFSSAAKSPIDPTREWQVMGENPLQFYFHNSNCRKSKESCLENKVTLSILSVWSGLSLTHANRMTQMCHECLQWLDLSSGIKQARTPAPRPGRRHRRTTRLKLCGLSSIICAVLCTMQQSSLTSKSKHFIDAVFTQERHAVCQLTKSSYFSWEPEKHWSPCGHSSYAQRLPLSRVRTAPPGCA